MGLTRNQVYARAYRGFESHPLRQSHEEIAFNSAAYVVIDLGGPPIGPPLRHRFRRHSPEILLNFVFVASDTLTVLDQYVQDRSVLDVAIPNAIFVANFENSPASPSAMLPALPHRLSGKGEGRE